MSAPVRDRLLDAAIHIAGAEGHDKVTYRSVAALAGTSHSLVRFYFGTREALLTEAFERAARRDAAEAKLRAGTVEEFGSNLVHLITEARDRQLLQYDFLLRAARGDGEMAPVAQLYEHYVAQVAATLSALGIDDPGDSRAALVFAALDGLVLQHLVHSSAARTEETLLRLREVLTLWKPAH
ncbi:putative transcriptional regulator, TetR family protein [Paractinoplanes abujensis]|uniref:AcrR family transcriptional regulator n=1 Tax=Paractinoplanes abujensis TaxID=882441 RepID=A0A7W7CPR6_9ACTN|nr:TetR family transcriptional regulator [Actinoplanes abujensis]MBB4692476.1 AcrR family transcriptional regulator [Actinoplanes abujensis]GID24048.1 putative transcriptional regulator, TetR family protein [Actinoplanes abujensis]